MTRQQRGFMIGLTAAAALFAVTMIATGAQAGPRAREHARNKAQRHRISEGVRSGELTRGEAKRLRAQQHRIHNMERRAKKDGVITDAEAGRIEKAQDRASKNIYKQKHDDQARPGRAENSNDQQRGDGAQPAQPNPGAGEGAVPAEPATPPSQ